jgi:uncharacterized protein (TIGR03435 family)
MRIVTLTLLALGLAAQSSPSFDVVSVKQNHSVGESGRISGPTPGRFTIANTPLRFIILYAFDLRDHQLVGVPEWAVETAFDITATYPTGFQPTAKNTREMTQRLLADRFGLVMHHETRELPMYALVVVRKDGALGPQLVRSDVDCQKWFAEKRPQLGAGGPSPVAPGGKRPACMMYASRQFITAGTQTIQQLSVSLQSLIGRPVVDRTGLTGAFDIDLQWTSGTVPAPGRDASPDDGPSIFTALQEQLWLKLESTRGPFEVVVIDSVKRPSAD